MQGMPDPSAQHHPRPNLMAQQQQQPNNMPVQANNQQGMRPTMGGMPGQPWNQQQNHPGQPQMAGQQGMPQQQGNLNPQQQQQMRMNQQALRAPREPPVQRVGFLFKFCLALFERFWFVFVSKESFF